MINFRNLSKIEKILRKLLTFINTKEYLKIKKNTIINEPVGKKNYDGL